MSRSWLCRLYSAVRFVRGSLVLFGLRFTDRGRGDGTLPLDHGIVLKDIELLDRDEAVSVVERNVLGVRALAREAEGVSQVREPRWLQRAAAPPRRHRDRSRRTRRHLTLSPLKTDADQGRTDPFALHCSRSPRFEDAAPSGPA